MLRNPSAVSNKSAIIKTNNVEYLILVADNVALRKERRNVLLEFNTNENELSMCFISFVHINAWSNLFFLKTTHKHIYGIR